MTEIAAVPKRLWVFPALLFAVIVLIEAGGYLAVMTPPDRFILSVLEMLVMFALLWNGWQIRSWVYAQPGTSLLVRSNATLVFVSLALCLGGDWINRNFSETYFAYDQIIEHSYLADSVWFFLPGYSVFIVACWRLARGATSLALRLVSLGAAASGGLWTFLSLVPEGTSFYVQAMTGPYTVVISCMAVAGLWLWLTLGARVWPVALGAVLATVADALIGHFWLFGEGYYPAIAYINFVVYFLSQALIQQLPLYAARFPDHRHSRGKK
ncbi:MAG: hypothetical protein ACQES2_06495 [Pseudomonadota bacterium]